ncbi:hypothetical protein ABIC01_000989 [Bradyrhizobium sp. RT4b]
MSKKDELRYGPVGAEAIHLCVDMQRMFAEDTDWKMPWLPRPAERRGDNGRAPGAHGLHPLHSGERSRPRRRHVAPLL